MLEKNSEIELNGRKILIKKYLGKGKGGYSYLAEDKGKEVVYKEIHYEPCEYYTFEDNKVKSEIGAYNHLNSIGINLPNLIEYSEEKNYILKEYIDGNTAAELISMEKIEEKHFEKIFVMAKKLYEKNTNIDFFPTNFVYENVNNSMYYVDYECNILLDEWNFENWGIYFWLNSLGMKEHLEKGKSDKLCKPNSAKPITDGFEKKAKELIEKYGK